MLTVTQNMMLPTAITGSYPRPLWFDLSLNGRSFKSALGESIFRIYYHGAEFEHAEMGTFYTYAFLSNQNGAAAGEFDHDGVVSDVGRGMADEGPCDRVV